MDEYSTSLVKKFTTTYVILKKLTNQELAEYGIFTNSITDRFPKNPQNSSFKIPTYPCNLTWNCPVYDCPVCKIPCRICNPQPTNSD